MSSTRNPLNKAISEASLAQPAQTQSQCPGSLSIPSDGAGAVDKLLKSITVVAFAD